MAQQCYGWHGAMTNIIHRVIASDSEAPPSAGPRCSLLAMTRFPLLATLSCCRFLRKRLKFLQEGEDHDTAAGGGREDPVRNSLSVVVVAGIDAAVVVS